MDAAVINLPAYSLERRSDGAVVVRVPSRATAAPRLPEAVFAFRVGDPQFQYWDQQLREREHGGS